MFECRRCQLLDHLRCRVHHGRPRALVGECLLGRYKLRRSGCGSDGVVQRFRERRHGGFATTQPTCTTAATSSSSVGSYPTSCSSAVDANYSITYVAGSDTIGPAPLSVTASSSSMTYGATVPTVSASYSGFVNGDTAASLTTQPTCAATATPASPVGTYPSSCGGAVDANYTVTYVEGSVQVTPAALAITASSVQATYGSAVSAITASYSGFVNGDTAGSLTTQPSCSTTATASSPVGVYDTSCSGASDSNYTITYLDGSVQVQPAALSITASSASITYGGAAPVISATYSGFVNGDTAASLTTPPTCTTPVTSVTPIGTYGSTCSGAVDSNYTITYVDGSVQVQPASITITASSATITYGSSPAAVTAIVSGLQNGESVSVPGRGPHVHIAGDRQQSCGELPHVVLWGRGLELHHQLWGRIGDGTSGRVVGVGVVRVGYLRRVGADHHGVVLGVRQR